MSLSRFLVTSSFRAWSPADRDRPERRVSVSPGPRDLFTDEADGSGAYIRFLKDGSWYEAERGAFEVATLPHMERERQPA